MRQGWKDRGQAAARASTWAPAPERIAAQWGPPFRQFIDENERNSAESAPAQSGLGTGSVRTQSRFQRRSPSALAITLTLDSAMAAPATTGLR